MGILLSWSFFLIPLAIYGAGVIIAVPVLFGKSKVDIFLAILIASFHASWLIILSLRIDDKVTWEWSAIWLPLYIGQSLCGVTALVWCFVTSEKPFIEAIKFFGVITLILILLVPLYLPTLFYLEGTIPAALYAGIPYIIEFSVPMFLWLLYLIGKWCQCVFCGCCRS